MYWAYHCQQSSVELHVHTPRVLMRRLAEPSEVLHQFPLTQNHRDDAGDARKRPHREPYDRLEFDLKKRTHTKPTLRKVRFGNTGKTSMRGCLYVLGYVCTYVERQNSERPPNMCV